MAKSPESCLSVTRAKKDGATEELAPDRPVPCGSC